MKECDNLKVIDGNHACAEMAYNLSEMCFIYPITPSSPMATHMDELASLGKKNMFDDTVSVVEMQSEAGAAGAFHGALSAGTLASTFTASQGLLLMLPNMYKIAGEMLPGVIHTASRSIATQALSIFGDHQDIYAVRQTGFCILASTNVQDAYNLALVAHLSSIESSLPFIHFFDGFRTSHEYNQIEEIDQDFVYKLMDMKKIESFRNRALNSGKCITKGTAQNEDVYFQSMEARNQDYQNVPNIVNTYMEKINKKLQTDYKPFNYYGSNNARYVIMAMGSVCDTIKSVVEDLNKKENIYGVIEVHLYRPFSYEYLDSVLPKSVTNMAVLDRTKESGSIGEPLYLDALGALKYKKIDIVGGRYGLSSKNTTPNDIYDVFMMLKNKPKTNFTIGINDDITNTSLSHYDYILKNNYREFKIYGFGSDGMVSASKNILKILGETNYVQGYYEYDSKKSGGVTLSHLRLSKTVIEAPYYTTNPELIVVTKDEYFNKLNMTSNLKPNGMLLISTTKNEQELNELLPDNVKKTINDNKIKVYTIDASNIAEKNKIKGKISIIVEACILNLLGIKDYEKKLTVEVKNMFSAKGNDIVLANLNSIKESIKHLKLVKIDNQSGKVLSSPQNIFEQINRRDGDTLPVSALMPYKDGVFPGGTAAFEKRKMSDMVPKWDKTNCIECGFCALVCPHAVIRPFLLDKDSKYSQESKNSITSNKDYIISVSEADCTGCGLCINTCPKKCLSFGKYDEQKQLMANDLFKNYKNPELPLTTINNIELRKPLFEFSGACAGCGETPYLKLLTQIVGEKLVIANATGCSSIYGASCPNTPYLLSWSNSLFEDNAEYGLGILNTYNKLHNRVLNELKENDTKESKELLKYLEDNQNDYSKIKEKANEIASLIPADLKDYITPKSVWTVGGDGWAYDIGFGGLDHVLSSNQNVKVLVLDTEVYSNTGGQSSKSSHYGVVAEFADTGKKTEKKDLFKIAMTYPNIYVATISLGANMMQAINVLKEAEAHNGPSLVMAYSPCIEHGIKGGMGNSINEEKLAVDVGYTILMRYKDNQLAIDSKEPDFEKYEDFLNNEIRYSSLKIKNKKMADELLEINKTNAIKRYEYYKNLIKK